MQSDVGKQIGQATKWSSLTEILAKLVSPIVNMVLARLLTPEAFGTVATITMVISFAEIFTDAGFQKYLIQHEFRNEEELNRSTDVAFWTNLTVSLFICAVIFFFREAIAELVGSPGLGNSISIASVLILVAALSSIQMARYRREFDFKTLFYARMAAVLVPIVVTIPLALALRNYWALLIGNFASQSLIAAILTIKSKWKPSLYFSFTTLKEMLSFSTWTLLESISIWLTGYIGVFIVGNYLDQYYLGLYKTSMSTVNAYMGIITGAITPVLFSALSRYQHDEQAFKDTYYRFQRLVAVLIFPMGIGIYLFRELVTSILLGSQWMEASGFVGLWGLTSSFAIIFSHFSSEVFRSKGKPKISLFVQILHLAFIVPILLISVRYSFDVLCTARSLVRFQMILTTMVLMHFMYRIRIGKVLKNVFPMLLASVVMVLIGAWMKNVSGSIVWQFFCILICVLVYFTVLLSCFPKTRAELLELVLAKRKST